MAAGNFPIYENPNPASRGLVPYLLMVQSALLDDLSTRIVVPLYRTSGVPEATITRLHLSLDLAGESLLAAFQHLTAVPRHCLGRQVGQLSDRHAEITACLDFIFRGY
jgi:toxin CcdB